MIAGRNAPKPVPAELPTSLRDAPRYRGDFFGLDGRVEGGVVRSTPHEAARFCAGHGGALAAQQPGQRLLFTIVSDTLMAISIETWDSEHVALIGTVRPCDEHGEPVSE
jgi:hypothetical protein